MFRGPSQLRARRAQVAGSLRQGGADRGELPVQGPPWAKARSSLVTKHVLNVRTARPSDGHLRKLATVRPTNAFAGQAWRMQTPPPGRGHDTPEAGPDGNSL